MTLLPWRPTNDQHLSLSDMSLHRGIQPISSDRERTEQLWFYKKYDTKDGGSSTIDTRKKGIGNAPRDAR